MIALSMCYYFIIFVSIGQCFSVLKNGHNKTAAVGSWFGSVAVAVVPDLK